MAADREAPPSEAAEPAGPAPECQACPICAGLAMLRGARPEVVEHLAKAGAELLLAARALLDGAAADGQAAPGRRRRPDGAADAAGNGLQRIDIG